MTGRSNLHLPLLICVLLLVCMLLLTGCGSTPWVSSIQVVPASQTLQGVGATVQYKAMGTLTNREHPQTYKDVTNQVAWSSSVESVATISSVGLATGVGAGTTTITPSLCMGFDLTEVC
jgi:peptidoglycan/LPS O-acetylase OafA/YrhL